MFSEINQMELVNLPFGFASFSISSEHDGGLFDPSVFLYIIGQTRSVVLVMVAIYQVVTVGLP